MGTIGCAGVVLDGITSIRFCMRFSNRSILDLMSSICSAWVLAARQLESTDPTASAHLRLSSSLYSHAVPRSLQATHCGLCPSHRILLSRLSAQLFSGTGVHHSPATTGIARSRDMGDMTTSRSRVPGSLTRRRGASCSRHGNMNLEEVMRRQTTEWPREPVAPISPATGRADGRPSFLFQPSESV